MSDEIRAMSLGFELPRNFLNPDRYLPEPLSEEFVAGIPDVVSTAVFVAMDANVPIDAFNPFIYLRNGRLPEYVVAYFMTLVSRRVKSNMSRFFTAMHLIEMYREYIIVPPTHFLAALDTAAVQPGDSTVTKDEKKQQEEDRDKEEDSSSVAQAQPSTSKN